MAWGNPGRDAAVLVALLAVALSACGAASNRALPRAGGTSSDPSVDRGARPEPPRTPTAASSALALCTAALGGTAIAWSSTTVGTARAWSLGGPTPPPGSTARQPARDAFPGERPSAAAAWCTTGGGGKYKFYVVGPRHQAVYLEDVGDWPGPVPDRPVPLP